MQTTTMLSSSESILPSTASTAFGASTEASAAGAQALSVTVTTSLASPSPSLSEKDDTSEELGKEMPPLETLKKSPQHFFVGGTPSFASSGEKAQFEADKRAIYKHPMFPLLAFLFEKCEYATQSAECPSSESFSKDIQSFIEQQKGKNKPLMSEDSEANELMIKAIQVLRIHLLELEKVQELCKDFCNRYITCLKGKMQSENLLRSDYGGYDSDDDGASVASSNSSSQQQQQRAAAAAAISSMAMAQHYMHQHAVAAAQNGQPALPIPLSVQSQSSNSHLQ